MRRLSEGSPLRGVSLSRSQWNLKMSRRHRSHRIAYYAILWSAWDVQSKYHLSPPVFRIGIRVVRASRPLSLRVAELMSLNETWCDKMMYIMRQMCLGISESWHWGLFIPRDIVRPPVSTFSKMLRWCTGDRLLALSYLIGNRGTLYIRFSPSPKFFPPQLCSTGHKMKVCQSSGRSGRSKFIL
jgi:hypothetical protein